MTWLCVGVVASAGVYVAHRIGAWNKVMGMGGLTLSSVVRSTWETIICAGLSVGLPVLFREMFHRPHWLLVTMAAASFAAYILYLAIVMPVQATIEGLALPAIIKFALVAVSATILAFALAHLSSNVPGLRTVLGTWAPGAQAAPVSADCSVSERAWRASKPWAGLRWRHRTGRNSGLAVSLKAIAAALGVSPDLQRPAPFGLGRLQLLLRQLEQRRLGWPRLPDCRAQSRKQASHKPRQEPNVAMGATYCANI
jgi:hypothetical protein